MAITHLVGPAVERALSVDTVLKVVRVVLAPVPAQDVVEAGAEGFVFPTLDAPTLVAKRATLTLVKGFARFRRLPST